MPIPQLFHLLKLADQICCEYMLQSLDNVSGPIDINPQLPIHERMALALKHAGVSITVTSVTDVTAFLIGATTVDILDKITILNPLFSSVLIFKNRQSQH